VSRPACWSLAENTVDAVVAPALWAVVAGAPGALGYRAVNTMDAMVGHRSVRYARFGWASARLDDVANSHMSRSKSISTRPGTT
jgi:adenosylcobinamide-phosphate synthase